MLLALQNLLRFKLAFALVKSTLYAYDFTEVFQNGKISKIMVIFSE